MKERKAANDGEGGEVDIRQEEVIDVEQTPLFDTQSPGYYQQNQCGKRRNYTRSVEQTACF